MGKPTADTRDTECEELDVLFAAAAAIGAVPAQGELGDPGRIAVAAPRLGVPGRSAPGERSCDPQLRRLGVQIAAIA